MKHLWSVNTFRAILDREITCAHRHEEEFCLLVCDGSSVAHASKLKEILLRRIRATDKAGWLDQQHIGIILPDTPRAGAHRLADDLSEKLSTSEAFLSCRVYTYPSQWLFVSRVWSKASG